MAYAQMPLIMSPYQEKLGLNFGVFTYIHNLCIPAAKALKSLRICGDIPESSLLTDAISTKIMCTGLYAYIGINVTKPASEGLRTTLAQTSLRSLISAFVIHLLESIISRFARSKISIF